MIRLQRKYFIVLYDLVHRISKVFAAGLHKRERGSDKTIRLHLLLLREIGTGHVRFWFIGLPGLLRNEIAPIREYKE